MWKAFDELEPLGLDRPASGRGWSRCRPRAARRSCARSSAGERHAELWQNAPRSRGGLRVPAAIGDYLILDAIRASGGTALAVDRRRDAWPRPTWSAGARGSDVPGGRRDASPASSSCAQRGLVGPDERVVLFNTGAGMVYPDLQSADLPRVDLAAPVIPGSTASRAARGRRHRQEARRRRALARRDRLVRARLRRRRGDRLPGGRLPDGGLLPRHERTARRPT